MLTMQTTAPTLGGVTEDEETPGRMIKRRREALGVPIKELAELAGMSRDQLSEIERGKVSSPRGHTIGAIERALTELEEKTSGPYDDERPGLVTFRMSGNFGVDVVVQGPVENLDELEASVERLIQRMRSQD
jgi:transcriptional regulator with XRE-family HTH domain